MNYELIYRPFSERSILIEWPSKIDEDILNDVLLFKYHIEKEYIKPIVQINSAYSSILIIYNYTIENINDEVLTLKSLYSTRINLKASACKLWKVPVCYDDEFSIDLDEMSREKQLPKSEIVTLHSEAIYSVYFIGFLPGFLYLGGLDKRLHFPRKESPRFQIKKGAVAIGASQTGIYPNASPGGWNIIGNSPLEFFNSDKAEPCFAKAGDKIQFVKVTRSEYDSILIEVEQGMYIIESELIDG